MRAKQRGRCVMEYRHCAVATGAAVHEVLIRWLGFLVLTIAGERLELSRICHRRPLGGAVMALALLHASLALRLQHDASGSFAPAH